MFVTDTRGIATVNRPAGCNCMFSYNPTLRGVSTAIGPHARQRFPAYKAHDTNQSQAEPKQKRC